MPASLFYSETPGNPENFMMDGGAAAGSNAFNGAGSAEQLALQLALLQGQGAGHAAAAAAAASSSSVGMAGHQTEWSTGENGVAASIRSSMMDDPSSSMRAMQQHFNGASSVHHPGQGGGFRGSLEDLKLPPQRKSQNMTECVPVPTSEHVAEIVGRQGCKIKALRAKTNTYIKTPVRGEEPVFVVTGRKEDVALAKREILSAADHFSQIRASRKSNVNSTLAFGHLVANQPGQTTVQVRVPYRVVGLVVGPKGATIKRIQQQTRTYIVTPSRDKEPVFEVTGLPENVEVAKKEIEAHIAFRTGSSDAGSAEGSTSGGFGAFGNSSNLNDLNGDDNVFSSSNGSSLLSSGDMGRGDGGGMMGGGGRGGDHFNRGMSHHHHHMRQEQGMFNEGRGGPHQQQHSHHHHHMGNNNFNGHHEGGSFRSQQQQHHPAPFGNSSEASALSVAAAAAAANGKGITLQNILDSTSSFDMNGFGQQQQQQQQNGHHHHNLFGGPSSDNNWGESQDSGISNTPPFGDNKQVSQQAAAVERSGSGIWGDLNISKAMSGLKLEQNGGSGFAGVGAGVSGDMTRASVDLGALGRPSIIPLTSSNSLTLIDSSSAAPAQQQQVGQQQGHPAVIATSSTGSSAASLSEISPPNSMPHFANSAGNSAGSSSAGPASGDETNNVVDEAANLKKLYMIRGEELLRQNELNE